ncbi:molecular chaperone TorD [Budvicia diplopodorum]|uniref:molecular chaperone TorD n=1 Tax=Budvicia diplopodorum TaxID=1119056 RepID=UPI001359A070|nr:molecular chaperone TorD [Budvicia diplopodorum]
MPSIDQISRQRAEIYRWFSVFFAQELKQEQIDVLQQPSTVQHLLALKLTPPLEQPVSQFQGFLNQALKRLDNQLELAADYGTLFLMPPPEGVLLYAGYYPPNTPQDSRLAMWEYLRYIGYTCSQNEPPDHLAIQLEVLATLITTEPPLAQLNFIQQRLLNWLPLFERRCQQQDKFGFYSSLSSLLVAFIQQDIILLDEWVSLEAPCQ